MRKFKDKDTKQEPNVFTLKEKKEKKNRIWFLFPDDYYA